MKLSIFLFTLLLFAFPALADEIVLTVNQSDYYFLVGEDAFVPLYIENTHDSPISGLFTYSLTQEINQQGMHYQSSNTQSKSYTVPKGESGLNIGFGRSDQPSTLKVSMSFSYNGAGKEMVSELGTINIHFVADQSQKNNKENQQQSNQQQAAEQQSQNAEQQSQQQQSFREKMQEELKNMMQQPSAQQQVQKNQMQQDSSALKQQMQEQMRQQQDQKKEFEENLAKNEEFQKAHQELLKEGFNLTGASLDPEDENSGEFEFEYQKQGEKASLKGSMKNGTLDELNKQQSLSDEKVLEKLRQDDRFQRFEQQLKEEGFKEADLEIDQIENKTTVYMQFENQKNETARIKAEVIEQEVEDVKLERDRGFLWLWLSLLAAASVLSLLIYRRNQPKLEQVVGKAPKIDYRKEAKKILKESISLYQKGEKKEAYAKAASAIRFYYIHDLNLRKEVTSFELVSFLKQNKHAYSDPKKCLELCALVEFAKYKANKKDFDEIISLADKIIG